MIKEHGPFKLMYFPFTKESIDATLDLNYTPSRDRVEVTLFNNFFCPVGAYMYHLIKRVAQSFGDKVKIVEIEAKLETRLHWVSAFDQFLASCAFLRDSLAIWETSQVSKLMRAL